MASDASVGLIVWARAIRSQGRGSFTRSASRDPLMFRANGNSARAWPTELWGTLETNGRGRGVRRRPVHPREGVQYEGEPSGAQPLKQAILRANLSILRRRRDTFP